MSSAQQRMDVRLQDADIYKRGVLAARLSRVGSTVEFTYDAEYLAKRLPPVATSLPLSQFPVSTVGGAVPPFFAGLLPEGRRLTGLRRAVKTSVDDELSLLLAVGAEPVGDVQIVPTGSALPPEEPLVSVDRDFSEVLFDELLVDAGVVDPSAIAGVQDKASARMLSLPVGTSSGRFILKLDPPEYPQVVLNEAYFIGVARAGGLPVVDARVVHDRTGRPGLLVERFDRVRHDDGTVTSLAVEDATQVLGLYPSQKYAVSAEEVVEALTGLCAARPVAVRDVFQQFAFAWATGNGDVHAKNLSVLQGSSGEWRIAPSYDLPSTLPYNDHTMALTIGGRSDGLSRRSLLAFANRVGLTERAADRVLDAVLKATAEVEGEIAGGRIPLPVHVRRSWARGLRNRRRSLQ